MGHPVYCLLKSALRAVGSNTEGHVRETFSKERKEQNRLPEADRMKLRASSVVRRDEHDDSNE